MGDWLGRALGLLPAFDALAILALRSAALVSLGWLVAGQLKRALPACRRALWAVVVLGLLVLPLLTATLPAWRVLPGALLPAVELAVDRPAPVEALETVPASRPLTVSVPSWVTPAIDAAQPAVTLSWTDWLVLLWAAGTGCCLTLFTAGLWRLRRIRSTARSADPEWNRLSAAVARQFGVRRRVSLALSAEIASPATWGLRRPVIALPAGAGAWSHERLRLVLAHEMAHVARADWVWRLLAQAGCALYWFNPLAWVAARRLRFEQELACDQAVVDGGARPSLYAHHLLDIARAASRGPVLPLVALDMARQSQMEGRLMSILADRSARRLRRGLLLPALSIAAALPVVAAIQPQAPEVPEVASAVAPDPAPDAAAPPAPSAGPNLVQAPAPMAAPAPKATLAPVAAAGPAPRPALAPAPTSARSPALAPAPAPAPAAAPAPVPPPATSPSPAVRPELAPRVVTPPVPAAAPQGATDGTAAMAPRPALAPRADLPPAPVHAVLAAHGSIAPGSPAVAGRPVPPAVAPEDQERARELEAQIEAKAAEIEALVEPIHEEVERAMNEGMAAMQEQLHALELDMEPLAEEMSRIGEEMSQRLEQTLPDQLAVERHSLRAEAIARQIEERARLTERALEGATGDHAARTEAVRRMREEIEPLREELAEIHREIAQRHRDMGDMEELMAPYRAEMEALRQRMAPRREQIEAIRQKFEPKRLELERLRSERMNEVRARLETLRAELHELSRERARLHQRHWGDDSEE